MKIDKAFLKEHLRKSKDNEYILNLYRIYELCSKATGEDVLEHKKLLNSLEDKIYTVKGKTMSQESRIIYETKKILNKPITDKKLLEERNRLLTSLVDLDLNDEKSVNSIKNKIVVLEAKINLPINFFYNACSSFLSIYNSIYINEVLLYNDNINIKNLHIYNDNKDFKKIIIKKDNKGIYNMEVKLWKNLKN